MHFNHQLYVGGQAGWKGTNSAANCPIHANPRVMLQFDSRSTDYSPSASMHMYAKFIYVAIVLLASSSLSAAPDASVALFNGKDSSGWTYHLEKPDVKPSDVWSVKDGVLHCTGTPTGYLITKDSTFENYKLTLDWRWPGKGGNNGVLVHVTKPGELGVWPKCFEVQLQSGTAGELWVIGTTLKTKHADTHVDDRRHKNTIAARKNRLVNGTRWRLPAATTRLK